MPTMPFLVPRPAGRWELRESRATPRGPRSRTLASFRELDSEAIKQATDRSSKPLSADEVRALARHAGAPVTQTPADRAATELVHELAHGREPVSQLRRALLDALAEGGDLSDSERAAAVWIGVPPERRGRVLWDLLLLADRIPTPPRASASRSPRLASRTG